jgi:hypothetical protein
MLEEFKAPGTKVLRDGVAVFPRGEAADAPDPAGSERRDEPLLARPSRTASHGAWPFFGTCCPLTMLFMFFGAMKADGQRLEREVLEVERRRRSDGYGIGDDRARAEDDGLMHTGFGNRDVGTSRRGCRGRSRLRDMRLAGTHGEQHDQQR